MDELLLGLVPGLPDDVRARLREAADGIPLYAVETVRMLRDRGVLEQAGGGDVVTGDLTAFEVPQIAAGVDHLTARRGTRSGAPPAAGRLGARQDVHAPRVVRDLGRLGRRPSSRS